MGGVLRLGLNQRWGIDFSPPLWLSVFGIIISCFCKLHKLIPEVLQAIITMLYIPYNFITAEHFKELVNNVITALILQRFLLIFIVYSLP